MVKRTDIRAFINSPITLLALVAAQSSSHFENAFKITGPQITNESKSN